MSVESSIQKSQNSPDKSKQNGTPAPNEKLVPEKKSHHPVHYSTERKELPQEDELRIENLENEGGPPLG